MDDEPIFEGVPEGRTTGRAPQRRTEASGRTKAAPAKEITLDAKACQDEHCNMGVEGIEESPMEKDTDDGGEGDRERIRLREWIKNIPKTFEQTESTRRDWMTCFDRLHEELTRDWNDARRMVLKTVNQVEHGPSRPRKFVRFADGCNGELHVMTRRERGDLGISNVGNSKKEDDGWVGIKVTIDSGA